MAQVGDYIDDGDYRYTIIETSPNRYVSAKVIDNTKTMYSDINGSVSIDGDLYTLTDMSETFANCESLRYFSHDAFTIPSSVTNMSYTFYGCHDLTYLPTGFTISSGVTNMSGTFANCIRLKDLGKSFRIPSGVTNMYETFYGCESLEKLSGLLTIPSGVTDISFTFYGCSGLTSLPSGFTIPSGVTNMSGTFSGCSGLTSLPSGFTIPSSVANISFTFSYCLNLTSLPSGFTIPSGVTNMGYTFNDCHSLTSLPSGFTIPSGVTSMSNTFNDCHSLTSLPSGFTVPSGVTDMSNTFNNCYSLTSLPSGFTVPSGVTDMGYTFRNCSSLEGNVLFEPDHLYTGQYENMFTGTTKPIYLMDNGSQSTITAASSIADLFNNVYMSRDVNTAPTLSVNTTRVESLGDTTENQLGKYVYINSSINIYEDRYPGTEYSSIAFTMDGSSITPTVVTSPSGSGTLTYEGWYDTDDLLVHNFTVQVTDSLNHASPIMPFIFPGSIPTMDVMNGGHGLSLGMICPDDGFHCNWDATFYKTTKFRQAPGIIKMYAGSSAPDGWLLCDGSAVSRTDYALLFAVIGTTYGAGDGSTTFNVPDLSGRFALGAGEPNDNNVHAWGDNLTYNGTDKYDEHIGNMGGESRHGLTVQEMPSHAHTLDTLDSGAAYTAWTNDRVSGRHSADLNRGIGYTGGNATHNNMPPYTAVIYIISTGEPSENSDSTDLPVVRGVLVDGQSVVENEVASIQASMMLDFFYPVGSYYETSNVNFNPNTDWGGTWDKLDDGLFLQSTQTESKVGTNVAAGLPNITGGGNTCAYGENRGFTVSRWGAFTTGGTYNFKPGTSTAWQTNYLGLQFDASQSNAIYGRSTTVQPPSKLVYIWHRTA